MSRIIVTGTRGWHDTDRVGAWLVRELHGFKDLHIIHGGSGRVDLAAGEWAQRGWAKERVFPANWGDFGKSAGPRRNQHMVDAGAHLCVAFWDGESRGTLDCITRAVKAGIPVRIVPAADRPQSARAGEGR